LKTRLFVSVPVPVLRGVSLDVAGELERRQGDWQTRALSHPVEDRRLSVTLAYAL
jgi:stress response protein SCP2